MRWRYAQTSPQMHLIRNVHSQRGQRWNLRRWGKIKTDMMDSKSCSKTCWIAETNLPRSNMSRLTNALLADFAYFLLCFLTLLFSRPCFAFLALFFPPSLPLLSSFLTLLPFFPLLFFRPSFTSLLHLFNTFPSFFQCIPSSIFVFPSFFGFPFLVFWSISMHFLLMPACFLLFYSLAVFTYARLLPLHLLACFSYFFVDSLNGL